MYTLLLVTEEPIVELLKHAHLELLLLEEAQVVIPDVVWQAAIEKVPANKFEALERFLSPGEGAYGYPPKILRLPIDSKDGLVTVESLNRWMCKNPGAWYSDEYLPFNEYHDLLVICDQPEHWRGAVQKVESWQPFWNCAPHFRSYAELLEILHCEGGLEREDALAMLEPFGITHILRSYSERFEDYDRPDRYQPPTSRMDRLLKVRTIETPNLPEALLICAQERGDFSVIVNRFSLRSFSELLDHIRLFDLPLMPARAAQPYAPVATYFQRAEAEPRIGIVADPLVLLVFHRMVRLGVLETFFDKIVISKSIIDFLKYVEDGEASKCIHRWVETGSEQISLVGNSLAWRYAKGLGEEEFDHVAYWFANGYATVDHEIWAHIGEYSRGETDPVAYLYFSTSPWFYHPCDALSLDSDRGVRGGYLNRYPMTLEAFVAGLAVFGHLDDDDKLIEQFMEVTRMVPQIGA